MMADALIRVNAGPHIGLGHLQRSLSLAAALRELGCASVFLANDDPSVCERVTAAGFPVESVSVEPSWGAADAQHTLAFAQRHGCSLVVVDSDEDRAEFLNHLRSSGLRVCAIDDSAKYSFGCQVVVNGDAHAERLPYRSSAGDTKFLLGPAFCIIRKELWDVPVRQTREQPENVLLSLGGDDPHRLMPRLLSAMDALPACELTAIVGPFFRHAEDIQRIASTLKHDVRIVPSPESVRELMLRADLAVSAGGQTLYELARVGCPAVVITTADNQRLQVQAIAEQGAIVPVGHAQDDNIVEHAVSALHALWQDAGRRAVMSAAGQRLTDGQGALRVARALISCQAVTSADQPAGTV